MKKFEQVMLVKDALDNEYGFSPAVKDIVVVGGDTRGETIHARIRGNLYTVWTPTDSNGILLGTNSVVTKEN